ncbi:MAG: cache domain-containing protein, partial [Peptococcaceae bacterium]|nr:cache domain-containing protein [Peptococcaceae bacterium]
MKSRVILNTLINSLIIIGTLTFIVLVNVTVIQKANLDQSKAALSADYDLMIKAQVESVISILDYYYNRAMSGEMTLEGAKEEAAGVVRELRYGDDGYFWIDNSAGVNVVLLGWDMEGIVRLDAVDSYGYRYVRSFLEEGMKPGGGYTDYRFPMPDNIWESYPKRGYTKYFEPFDWVVGTGNYLERIDLMLDDFSVEMNSRSLRMILIMAAATLVLLVISTIISARLSNRSNRTEEKRLEEVVERRTAEISEQQTLMSLVNDMAVLLLESDILDYDNAMTRCMEKIGLQVDVDRVSVWKNSRKEDGRLYYRLVCQWANSGLPELDRETDFAYEEIMPSWETLFSKGISINGPVDSLSEQECAQLKVFGVQSILAIPIFLYGELWGFVSYDDYHSSREFPESENNVLRTWGLLSVGAIRRAEITRERIRLQRDLETAAIAAEAASRAKSNFLASMSHEIRTPMNAILGITDIQLQDEALAPSIQEALGKINNSGNLLLGIINDILDLSKIEAGKLVLADAVYEVASLISDTAQLNVMRIGSKPIEFEVDVDENTPATMLGDELRVKQILNNLLSNAFKYTAEGTVRLTVRGEAGGANETGAANVTVYFQVSDTGQGMTKEQVGRLFDEYARFNQEANKTTEGIGLGMSITKNLIDMMHGTIR